MRTFSFLCSLLVALAACGESTTLPDTGTTGDGATDTGGGADGAPDTGGGTDGATDTGDGTDGGGTDGGGTDGGGTDGGGTDGGGTDGGGTDGGGTDGGGTDGGGGTVDCGTMTCDLSTEQCCITGGGGGGAMAMCIPAADTCTGAVLDCDGPEDCPARRVCCAERDAMGITVSCVRATMCGGGGGSFGFELCHDAGDCTDGGDMCCPIMMGGLSAAYCSPMCFAP